MESSPGPGLQQRRVLYPLFLPSRAVVLVVSAVLAYGDRRNVSVAGADGPGVRVVGEGDARRPQLVDQARCLTGSGDLHGAAGWRLIALDEDGQRGQVRQDLVLPDVGVLGPAGSRAGRAGVAVAAPVGGLAVGP